MKLRNSSGKFIDVLGKIKYSILIFFFFKKESSYSLPVLLFASPELLSPLFHPGSLPQEADHVQLAAPGGRPRAWLM